jgi:hypothetical protein
MLPCFTTGALMMIIEVESQESNNREMFTPDGEITFQGLAFQPDARC